MSILVISINFSFGLKLYFFLLVLKEIKTFFWVPEIPWALGTALTEYVGSLSTGHQQLTCVSYHAAPSPDSQDAGSVFRDQGVSLCRQVSVVEFKCPTFTKSFLKNQWEICAYLYGKVYKSSVLVGKRGIEFTQKAWVLPCSILCMFLPYTTTGVEERDPEK